ncbi:cora-domain-containing protein [Thozetella sp. PMI_491]|nr:cora-domain-containing protein [Thozetella sp. PMI_491]
MPARPGPCLWTASIHRQISTVPRYPRARLWATAPTRLEDSPLRASYPCISSPSHRRQIHTTGLPRHGLGRPSHALSAEEAHALLDLSTKLSRHVSGDDITLRGTEINDKGEISQEHLVLTKHGITASFDLHGRDLRNIDLNSKSVPYIFVRPTTIIVNLFFLRLLVQCDRILILEPPDNVPSAFASRVKGLFLSNLEGRLRSTSQQPFEFRALEAALITAVCTLEAEYLLAREPARAALEVLQEKVDVERSQLQDLLFHSRRMSSLSNKARLVRDALQEVLNVDEDLAEMYLTDARAGKPHELLDHVEAEVLLETYCKVCDQVVEAAGSITEAIVKTEDNLKSILDAHRNQIMLLDVRLSIGMLGLASGTLVAGLYGMNLINGIEAAPWGFPVMAGCSFGVSALFILYGAVRLRRLNRIRMGLK